MAAMHNCASVLGLREKGGSIHGLDSMYDM